MGRSSKRALIPGGLAAAFAVTAAVHPSVFAQVQPGLWEISGAPGAHAPIRQCLLDVTALARFEHRTNNCTANVLKDVGSTAQIDYNCPGAGFGHSQIDVLTPRSLRISTQGISEGLPFNYVLQARRVDDCPKNASLTRH